MRWQNWSGRHQASVEGLKFIRSEADAVALVQQCASNGASIRVAGAGHSHSPIVLNDQVIADSSGLSGVISVDSTAQQAWIRAGSPIYALGGQLHEHGLALKNQGDIDRQFLGGAMATGTHGTGKDLQNISASVVALNIILAPGDVIECSKDEENELFEIARLSLGSVGFITQIKMQLGTSCVLKERIRRVGFEEIFDDIHGLVERHERFEFFWYPGTDEASVKTIDRTSDEPEYPLGDEGSRQAYSYELLPSHRPHLHTEMEYSVPLESGPACFAEIRQLLRTEFSEVKWPVEYRTVAQDDIWLSMASKRATVTISVHQDIREDEEAYYRACEEIFLSYNGRPHWGKVNYLSGDKLGSLYPEWSRWWRCRDHYDPAGVFLNEYIRSIGPH